MFNAINVLELILERVEYICLVSFIGHIFCLEEFVLS